MTLDADLAAKRMRRWRSEAGLSDDRLFAERLETDRLSPHLFGRVLGASDASLQSHFPEKPEWLRHLEAVYAEADQPIDFSIPHHLDQQIEHIEFLDLLKPLIADAYARLCRSLNHLAERHANMPIEVPTISRSCLSELCLRLCGMVARTLLLELQIRRLQGELRGDTPEARFADFIASLNQPEVSLTILREYPVLARQVVHTLERWIAVTYEVLQRLVTDQEAIAACFGFRGEFPRLVALQSGQGDTHAGGRSVTIVIFANDLKLVYKPRRLTVDSRFQILLAWLNDLGEFLPFRLLRILDRGTHGWVEYVEPLACQSPEELERFYQRQGALLALMYALAATDYHHENLIAAGEHPMLIDLETLFNPLPAEQLTPASGSTMTEGTVLDSGLLPQRVWTKQFSGGIDVSGIGASDNQTIEVGQLQASGTDEMHWTLAQVKYAINSQHRPTLANQDISPWVMRDQILSGFQTQYHILCRHRETLLAPDGPLAGFANDETRVILRPTSVYSQLLYAGLHPHLLRDALARDRTFDKLWLQAQEVASLRRVISAEIKALHQGDVPRFVTHPSSVDVSIDGGDRIEQFFATSGMEVVRNRIAALSHRDLERQSYLVRAALDSMLPSWAQTRPAPGALPPAAKPATANALLDMATRVGSRLADLAILQRGHLSWLQLDTIAERAWGVQPVDTSLFKGLSGMALFLAYLGQMTGVQRYTDLAKSAWDTVRELTQAEPPTMASTGGFSGYGGPLYTATHLAALWHDASLLEEAARLATRLPSYIEQDQTFDIIGGAAGTLACLLGLYRTYAANDVLAVATACGNHLLAHAERREQGMAWPSPQGSAYPLTGFGHGAAGIAWALAQLASVSGETAFLDAAKAALEYERSWFSDVEENWPDLRAPAEDREAWNYMHAWCHGSTGIGLGRLGMLPYVRDHKLLDEIQIAIRTTRRHGFGSNHCLCHGDLGNLDLLLKAGDVLHDRELQRCANHLAARILARIEQSGWLCGVRIHSEVLGLMVGLAGIGYGLLRAAAPQEVPSVLLLDPPVAGQRK